MKRREFMTLLGGAAAAWPLAARAQQPSKKIRSLGLLLPGLPEASTGKATRDRLRELGYAEGRDILLQARWANGNMERLDELAVELAHLQLDAIIAYTTPGAIAARKATTTIPIVFLFVGDPVEGERPMWKPEHRIAADRIGLRYPSDLTGAEWAIVEPMVPPAKQGGRKRSTCARF
jgi:ABC transporter substrate binding protein